MSSPLNGTPCFLWRFPEAATVRWNLKGYVSHAIQINKFRSGTGCSMEMRREMRYRLDASALFSWESAQHTRLQGEGVTRDISVFGAFIVTPCAPLLMFDPVMVVLPSLTGRKPVIRVSGARAYCESITVRKGKGETDSLL